MHDAVPCADRGDAPREPATPTPSLPQLVKDKVLGVEHGVAPREPDARRARPSGAKQQLLARTATSIWWVTLVVCIILPAAGIAYLAAPTLLYHVIPSVVNRVAEVYGLTLSFDPILPLRLILGLLAGLLGYVLWQAMFAPRWHQMAALDPVSRWCRSCRRFVPATADHCRLCHACVVYRSHHSLLINNCVGENNVALYHLLLSISRLLSGTALFFLLMDAALSQSYRPTYTLACAATLVSAALWRGKAFNHLMEVVERRDEDNQLDSEDEDGQLDSEDEDDQLDSEDEEDDTRG